MNQTKEDIKDLTNGDEIVKDYKKTLEQILSDDALTSYIEPEQDREMLLKGSIKEAEAKGIEQGKLEGLKEGIEQVACNFIKKGLDLESIAEATGLSIEELKRLQEQ